MKGTRARVSHYCAPQKSTSEIRARFFSFLCIFFHFYAFFSSPAPTEQREVVKPHRITLNGDNFGPKRSNNHFWRRKPDCVCSFHKHVIRLLTKVIISENKHNNHYVYCLKSLDK